MANRFRLEHLRRRVEANPASIAFAALAEGYLDAGLLDEAIETCRRGLRRHPSYVSARLTLAAALMDAGRLDEAQEQLERIFISAPENLRAVQMLAQVHGLRSGELARRPRRTPAERRTIEALDGLLAAIHQVRSAVRATR